MPFFDNGQGLLIDRSPMTDIAGGQNNVNITMSNTQNTQSATGEYRGSKNMLLAHGLGVNISCAQDQSNYFIRHHRCRSVMRRYTLANSF